MQACQWIEDDILELEDIPGMVWGSYRDRAGDMGYQCGNKVRKLCIPRSDIQCSSSLLSICLDTSGLFEVTSNVEIAQMNDTESWRWSPRTGFLCL